jgi:hypothetical protein
LLLSWMHLPAAAVLSTSGNCSLKECRQHQWKGFFSHLHVLHLH